MYTAKHNVEIHRFNLFIKMAYRGNGPQSSNGFMNGRVEQVSQFGYVGSLTSFLSLPTFRFNPGYPYRFNFFFLFLFYPFVFSEYKIKNLKSIEEEKRSKLSILIKIKNIYISLENIIRF